MNRTIKFRVWDTVGKQMSPVFHLFGEFTLLGAVHAWQRDFRTDEKDSLMMLNDLEIMQFTGLRDKAKREIFEGDILESADGGSPIRAEVYFGENDFLTGVVGWCVEFKRGSNFLDKPKKWKVIGNVHENPELVR